MNGVTEKSHLQNKKSIITLYSISRNALDAFLWPILVFTKWFTLSVNRMNHWNDDWNFFWETSISNTLLTLKLIWNIPIRPERKIILRQKIFGPYFSSLICVLASVEVPLSHRIILKEIRRLIKVTVYVFRQVHV